MEKHTTNSGRVPKLWHISSHKNGNFMNRAMGSSRFKSVCTRIATLRRNPTQDATALLRTIMRVD